MNEFIPLPQESEVTVLETFEHDGKTIRKGDTLILEEYMTPTSEPGHYSHAYYANYRGGYGNVVVDADNVKLSRDPEEMRTRSLPTEDELATGLTTALCGMYGDNWESHSAEYVGAGVFEVMGTAENGLEFAFYLTVSEIGRVDF